MSGAVQSSGGLERGQRQFRIDESQVQVELFDERLLVGRHRLLLRSQCELLDELSVYFFFEGVPRLLQLLGEFHVVILGAHCFELGLLERLLVILLAVHVLFEQIVVYDRQLWLHIVLVAKVFRDHLLVVLRLFVPAVVAHVWWQVLDFL